MDILSHGMRFRKGTGSPFTPLDPMGLQWCRHCLMETDTITRAYCQGQVFAIKRWCRRCGKTQVGGVYYNAPIISAIPNSTFSLAQQWAAAGSKTE